MTSEPSNSLRTLGDGNGISTHRFRRIAISGKKNEYGDTEGNVYDGYDDFLYLVGSDIQQALIAICANKKIQKFLELVI
jgi:hypothetical protein